MPGDESTRTESGEGTQPTDTSVKAEKVFTQSDLDAHVKRIKADLERRQGRREDELKLNAVREYLESAGLSAEDLEETKSRLAKLRSADDEGKSLTRRLTRAEKERDELASKLAALEGKEREANLRSQVFEIAQKNGCDDSRLLYHLLRGEGRLSLDGGEVVVRDENGTVSSQSLEDLVKTTLSANPRLIAASKTSGAGSRPALGGAPNGAPNLLTKEGRRAALSEMFKLGHDR